MEALMAEFPIVDLTQDLKPPYFVDTRHALYAGWVMGIARKNGLDCLPVVDMEGNYTGEYTYEIEGGITVTIKVPYPPKNWSPQ
jgi:hypothetical protein